MENNIMQLAKKGASANVNRFKQLLLTMSWTAGCDFDICAVYEKKDGTFGIVYFGDKGDLNSSPFISHSGDEGVGDKAGANEEQMRIASLDEMKNVWIVCWDYTKVEAGQPARFAGSDVKLAVMDDQGRDYQVVLDTGSMGNVAVVARIDNSSPMGASLVNFSKAGTLKGLSDLDQLLGIINS